VVLVFSWGVHIIPPDCSCQQLRATFQYLFLWLLLVVVWRLLANLFSFLRLLGLDFLWHTSLGLTVLLLVHVSFYFPTGLRKCLAFMPYPAVCSILLGDKVTFLLHNLTFCRQPNFEHCCIFHCLYIVLSMVNSYQTGRCHMAEDSTQHFFCYRQKFHYFLVFTRRIKIRDNVKFHQHRIHVRWGCLNPGAPVKCTEKLVQWMKDYKSGDFLPHICQTCHTQSPSTKEVGSSRATSDLNLGGTQFKCQLEHQLFWLTFYHGFPQFFLGNAGIVP
jgi:hypothetical protein